MAYDKTSTIPVIESEAFVGHDEARFAIGIIAVKGQIVNGYEREFKGAANLRANVYLAKGFTSPEALNDDGTELDADDMRSAHFVVLERTAVDSLARVVGNMRLVVKESSEHPLPIEQLYPEVFEAENAALQSTEASRLISRHEDPLMQNLLKWPLFIAGVKYAEKNYLGPAYGLVEPKLARSLTQEHVPASILAGARYIPEINAVKQPIEIDVAKFSKLISSTGDMGIDIDKHGFSYIDFEGEKTQDSNSDMEAESVEA